jgi:trans-aconitate methyltransferase
MADSLETASHWDVIYGTKGAKKVSWYQPAPRVSLELIRQIDVAVDVPVIDIGGGGSLLVDNLHVRGFVDLTVLDISKVALAEGNRRMGPKSVHWLQADVRTWKPDRRYGLWHDRAVFHFLVDPADRTAYLRNLQAATAPGSVLILATFAPDGPETCSGLPVARYSSDALAEVLGESFEALSSLEEQHATPAGVVQPFTWIAGRMR